MSENLEGIDVVGGRRSPAGGVGLVVRLVRLALFFASLGALASVAVVAGVYATFSNGLPSFESVDQYRPKLVTKIFSVDGRLIGEFATERRIVVPYERIPKRLVQAFIAAEDKKFFDHGGIDWLGMGNAVMQKVTGQAKKLRGASTITQQLAKSLLVSSEGFAAATERSVRRKVREAILARRLEATLNKEEIIWLYLNQVYLGHGAYGVQAAAENYFRKDVFELSLAEMAVLAGLPQAPSKFSPFVAPTAARARQEYVLGRMQTDGYITGEERAEALAESVEKTVHARDDRFRDTAPYFTEHVRRYVYDTYGEKALYEGGLEVRTTLDLERQHHAEKALSEGVREVDKRQGWLGPVAHLDTDAQVQKTLKLVDDKFVRGKPLEEGWPYLAVVQSVDAAGARVRVGEKLTGVLPLSGMRWARKPNPNRSWEGEKVEDARKVVARNDVVMVVPVARERFAKLALGNAAPPDDVEDQLFLLEQDPRVQGALIALNPTTGYVESMIGGYAFEESEFNRAFQSCLQPGSTFKPIVYAAAIAREDYTPATMVQDVPITLRDTDNLSSWKPQNFEGGFKGEVTAREALMNSMNMPALHTMQKVGVKEAVAYARHLGIKTELKEELGTAIGSSCLTPWELTSVYTTFARQGLRPEPVFIKRIVDRDGKLLEGQASPNDPWQTHDERLDSLYRMLEQPPYRLMDPVDAYQIHWMLTQVAMSGTASRAYSTLKRPVAGKTGTTNDSFDTWFVGYTSTLASAVWIGYDTHEYPLSAGEQGGRTSLPIWLDFMIPALAGKVEPEWSPPAGICYARVDGRTGYRTPVEAPGNFVAPVPCGEEPPGQPVAGSVSLEDAVKRGGI
jgi:penicillin-binding protein 1A